MHLYHHVRTAPDKKSIWEIEADELGTLIFIKHVPDNILFEIYNSGKLSRPALFPKLGFNPNNEPFVVCKFGVEGSDVPDDCYLITINGKEIFLSKCRGNNPCYVSDTGIISVQKTKGNEQGLATFSLFDTFGNWLQDTEDRYDSSGIHYIDDDTNKRIMYMDTFGPIDKEGIKILNLFYDNDYGIATTDKYVNSGVVLFTPTERKYFNHYSPHPAYVASIGEFFKTAISGHDIPRSDTTIWEDEKSVNPPVVIPPVNSNDCKIYKDHILVLNDQLIEAAKLKSNALNELKMQIDDNKFLVDENKELKAKLDRIPLWIRKAFKAT